MKFSIRDLLLVTVIAALAVGWWLDHRRQAQTISDLQRISVEPIRTFYTADLNAFFRAQAAQQKQ